MSDTGNSSPRGVTGSGLERLNAGVLQKTRNRASAQHNRSRHRGTPARVKVLGSVSQHVLINVFFIAASTLDWFRRPRRH